MTTENAKVLLCEDDENFGDVLRSYLEMNDFEVKLAVDGSQGWNTYQNEDFDLCILDVMMPKKDGFTLAQEIRKKDKEIPIIFLTAKTMKEDVLKGFESGADDYITKPFSSEELLMRIQAILKRSQKRRTQSIPKEYTFGDFTFNYPLRILSYKDEEEQKLSPKEAQLLQLLAHAKNQVVERSVALEKIWGEDSYFTARSMDVFIAKLRKYLKVDADVEIVNIHGNGFQLLCPEPSSDN
jgi:DNA-binding response OmpR family regulator